MLRGIGYVIARRDPADPDEPRDWALFMEALFRGLLTRFPGLFAATLRQQPHGRESASARRPR